MGWASAAARRCRGGESPTRSCRRRPRAEAWDRRCRRAKSRRSERRKSDASPVRDGSTAGEPADARFWLRPPGRGLDTRRHCSPPGRARPTSRSHDVAKSRVPACWAAPTGNENPKGGSAVADRRGFKLLAGPKPALHSLGRPEACPIFHEEGWAADGSGFVGVKKRIGSEDDARVARPRFGISSGGIQAGGQGKGAKPCEEVFRLRGFRWGRRTTGG